MATNLLDWIADLLRDPDARESFFDRPDHYAREHGFDHLSPHDVHDSLQLLADDGFPSPRHFSHGDHHGDGAHYLRSYFHENRAFIDSRDTDINDRIHQDIDTGGHGHHGHDHGGDFHQTIDNDPVVASGDHSAAAGGDIRDSFVTSGRGNVIGDHNHVVSGNGGTTAFGTGEADSSSFDGARFGDGAGVSVGGDATGHSEHNSTNSSVHGGDGATSVNVAGADGHANEQALQPESESSVHLDYDDHTRNDDHSSSNSHNSAESHDSHDFDLHT
jgi:hypothetical protein